MLIARQWLAKPFGLLSLLLSQSCILLYQSDGGGAGGGGTSAGAGNPGGGGAGGAAAGGSAAGGAEVGGGGAGGDCADGGPMGDWLVDVGTFTNVGGEPGRLQSMVEMPNGTILLGGFSGAGFTTTNNDVITPNTFFLLELGQDGVIAEAKPLPFPAAANSGVEWTISLSRRNETLYAVLSNTLQLELMSYDGSEASPLLSCTSQINGLKLGSLTSNGDQLLLAMQLSGATTCTTPPSSCVLTATEASTVLWPVEDNNLDCAKYVIVGPQRGESYFSAPRVALGPTQGGNVADLLVTANGGTTNGFSHRRARSTLVGTTINATFDHAEIGPHTQPPLPVIPAVFQSPLANAFDAAIVGGSRGGTSEAHQFFIARASGTQTSDGSHYVDDTSSRLAALNANEDTLLAVGEFDPTALTALAVPGVTCSEPCAGWLAFDKDLKVVAHRITNYPSVRPLSGSVRSRSGILVDQAVFWTGDSSDDFDLGCESLSFDDDQRHAFVARNALPVP